VYRRHFTRKAKWASIQQLEAAVKMTEVGGRLRVNPTVLPKGQDASKE
jgi:hypothetical protein